MNDVRLTRLGSSEIAAKLRREISRGTLAARERLLPERELAEVYSVSRSTIRDALNQLSQEGLVEIKRGSGTYVTPDQTTMPDITQLVESARPLEMIDARFALEPHLCRLAVLHARSVDLDAMERLADAMEEDLLDPVLLIWFNTQITSVRNQEEWERMRHLTLNVDTIAVYNKQHRHILNAIRTREPERAASLMKEHLETARLSLTRAAST